MSVTRRVQQKGIRILAIGIAAAGLLVAGRHLVEKWEWGQLREGVPRDYVAKYRSGDVSGAIELRRQAIAKHLGESFPPIDLKNRITGEEVPLSEFRGHSVAMFFTGGDNPVTLSLLREFAAAGWKYPYADVLVILIPDESAKEYETLPAYERIFIVKWPFRGYLSYITTATSMLFMDEDGRLGGYFLTPADSAVTERFKPVIRARSGHSG